MAEVKTTAAKPVEKAVVKPAGKEAAKPVAKAEVKEAVKAPAATPAKKAPAKKAPAKRAAAKKEAVKAIVNLQFSGKSYTDEDLIKIAKDVWKYDLGNKSADFKSVELYVKPEESRAYYVINGETTGSFAI